MAIYGSRRHRICHPKLMANQSRNGVVATPSMMLYTVKESMIPLSPVARLTVSVRVFDRNIYINHIRQ